MFNWLKQRFCKHDMEEVTRITYMTTRFVEFIPNGYEIIYKCKKCGYVKRVKL